MGEKKLLIIEIHFHVKENHFDREINEEEIYVGWNKIYFHCKLFLNRMNCDKTFREKCYGKGSIDFVYSVCFIYLYI